MFKESAPLFLLSDDPIPAPLRPWVQHRHGVPLSKASVESQLSTWSSEPVSEHCWLVDGSAPGQWQACVRALRDTGWLEDLPWALWLPQAGARAANEAQAWEQGAVQVFDGEQGAALTHCVEALLQRLRFPHGRYDRAARLIDKASSTITTATAGC